MHKSSLFLNTVWILHRLKQKSPLILFLEWKSLNNTVVKFILLWEVQQGTSLKKITVLFYHLLQGWVGIVLYIYYLQWPRTWAVGQHMHVLSESAQDQWTLPADLNMWKHNITFQSSYSKSKPYVFTLKIHFLILKASTITLYQLLLQLSPLVSLPLSDEVK